MPAWQESQARIDLVIGFDLFPYGPAFAASANPISASRPCLILVNSACGLQKFPLIPWHLHDLHALLPGQNLSDDNFSAQRGKRQALPNRVLLTFADRPPKFVARLAASY
jgi:hypothetical protein